MLIHRIRDGHEYYVFPGGGMEDTENLESALIREVKEETNLDITSPERLWELEINEQANYFFLIRSFSDSVILGGPEKKRQSETNVYNLLWIPISEAKNLELMPLEAKEQLLRHFGF